MAYIVQSDLQEYLSNDVIRQLTDDLGDGVADSPRVTQCIVGATAEVDGYIVRRYDLPLSTTPPLVAELTCILTAYRLFQRRSRVPDSFEKIYEKAQEMLERIAEGKILLGTGSDDDAVPNEGGSISLRSRTRVHSRTTWQDW